MMKEWIVQRCLEEKKKLTFGFVSTYNGMCGNRCGSKNLEKLRETTNNCWIHFVKKNKFLMASKSMKLAFTS
jgi:hypothetical protein